MRRLQIFISSTYVDLIEERQRAVQTILKARHIPVGMEFFGAGQDVWATIRRWIDESDVFLLILGGRFGYVDETVKPDDPNYGKSYVQREYEYAVSIDKPLFALTMSDEYLRKKILATKGKPEKAREVGKFTDAHEIFKTNVKKNIAHEFSVIQDIESRILQNLNDIQEQHDFAGWVRGTEVYRLEAHIESLTQELKKKTH